MDDGNGDPFAHGAADLDMALDLDPSVGAPQRPSRSVRFQPKIKGKGKAKVDPAPDSSLQPPPAPAPAPVPVPVKKQEIDVDPAPPSSSVSSVPDAEASASVAMEVDGEDEVEGEVEDEVVREIDVLCSPAPLDEDTFLYIMQYVLRPSWRPYELNERCEEVRVKPKESKLEIDLSMDVDSENYDQEVDESLRLKKQTLCSSTTPLVTSYAIGILKENQLHLNPVHAVVQLRPSMAHLNTGLQKRKLDAQSVESSKMSNANATDSAGLSMKQPWVSLEYHAVDSHLTERYHHRMIAKDSQPIPFMMKPSDYIDSLCPGTSTENKRTKVPTRRFLLSLPVEERLKKWLSEVSQVNHFKALMHLAPDISEQELLKALPLYADLVQGLWVCKSSLLYEGNATLARDYILYEFSLKPTIPLDKLKVIKFDGLKSMLSALAVERPTFGDWKFRESTDFAFMKKYPDVVKEQEHAWSNRVKVVFQSIRGLGKNSHVLKSSSRQSSATGVNAGKVDADAHGGKDRHATKVVSSLSMETREHLPKALLKIFQEKKIRSINSIINGLRGLAISNSSRPRDDSKTKALINAATNGASAPVSELESIVCQIAVNVHGSYVLKSSGNPTLDPLRNVVIDLFRGKEPNAKINKQEIRIAAQTRLKKDISDSEYNQVEVSDADVWYARRTYMILAVFRFSLTGRLPVRTTQGKSLN
ncbi:hypothetical protein Cni_G03795 [Canna indica]|uniref:DNA-directed RNA polymerase III subunit RPC5 n=1 Tax=Canna indica TaxID=4628 RepID=A0AAQ3JRR5_9LILI|nr:hypothetical protein Cni_G03795 [Canna indica]